VCCIESELKSPPEKLQVTLLLIITGFARFLVCVFSWVGDRLLCCVFVNGGERERRREAFHIKTSMFVMPPCLIRLNR
jgi:hypothetical protein